MLRIFSTHGLFGFLLIGLMITSCGGNTSSNTPSGGTTSGGGGTTPTPQTLTVRVPSLNYAQTITKSTPISDITALRRDLNTQCTSLEANPFGSKARTCAAEVETAYNQAVAFIRS